MVRRNYIKPLPVLVLLVLFCVMGHAQDASQYKRFKSSQIEQPRTESVEKTAQPELKASYDLQRSYWQKQTIESKSNAATWFNYYAAHRFTAYTKTSKNITPAKQKELDAIVTDMEKSVPNSYEYHYVKYWNSNHDVNQFHHLQKAYELNPNSHELYDDFIAHYEITGQAEKKKEWCTRLKTAGITEKEIYQYNYNVLMSLEKGAVLITNGDDDTYPLWVLQNLENVRTDVTVLNLDLLEVDDYRQRKWKELGWTDQGSMADGRKHFLRNMSMASGKPVYYGFTVDPTLLKYFQNYLYCTGLAFRFSAVDYDNKKALQDNYETYFKTDYLKTAQSNPKVARMNMNYTMPLLLLHEQYQTQGNTSQVTEVEQLLNQISASAGRSGEVQKYLEKN